MAYSLGFNPSPKLSLGVALPLFVRSKGEIMDIELYEDISPDDLMKKLNDSLHADCRILQAKKMPDKHEAIEIEARWASYSATLPKKYLKKNEIDDIIKSVLEKNEIFIERTNKKGLKKQINIRKSIESVNAEETNDMIIMKFVLKATNSNSENENIPILRADDFINLIFPNMPWDITRLELLDADKTSLL